MLNQVGFNYPEEWDFEPYSKLDLCGELALHLKKKIKKD